MSIEDLIRRARDLLRLPDANPQEVAIQLLDAGHPPDLIALSVRAAVTLGPRTVPYHGESGFCPSCGAPGTFDLHGGLDMPLDWISLDCWECHACMWRNRP